MASAFLWCSRNRALRRAPERHWPNHINSLHVSSSSSMTEPLVVYRRPKFPSTELTPAYRNQPLKTFQYNQSISTSSSHLKDKASWSFLHHAIHQARYGIDICCPLHSSCNCRHDGCGDRLKNQHHHGNVQKTASSSKFHPHPEWPNVPHWTRSFPCNISAKHCLVSLNYWVCLSKSLSALPKSSALLAPIFRQWA